MKRNNPYQTYQNNAVNTASGGELTLMLYNGCIKFIRRAIQNMNDEQYEAKNKNIQKAQDIIQELMLTLDSKVTISREMMSLYEYMNHRLIEANVKNDARALEEVLQFATEFRDTWKQVLLKARQNQYTQGAQV
ncbi:MAG TPA: flagellar export chaperone FliS [Bacillota bacterium]|nr:flagellar export chaperone FliS [Bacillota bacterium]